MNNLNDIRILVREIISEKFEGGIEGGMFQSASDKSARSSSSSNYEGKEKDSLYPFSGSITDRPTYEKVKKKVDLKIQEKYPNIINDDEFKKMNEEYFKLFQIFLQSKNIPTSLTDFNNNIKNPFFKKNQNLLSIPEVKSFYGIK